MQVSAKMAPKLICRCTHMLCFTVFLEATSENSCLEMSCTKQMNGGFVFADTRNVLVLVVDDYGKQLGTYGNKVCKTPNLDSLAQRSLILEHSFTSVAAAPPLGRPS